MVIVIGTFAVDPARRDEFLAERLERMRTSRAEAGCLEYTFAADPLEPGRVVLTERWADQAALDAHLAAPRSGSSRRGARRRVDRDLRRGGRAATRSLSAGRPVEARARPSRRHRTRARRRQSAAHRVAEVERPGALDHDGVVEHDVSADELAEVGDAGAEQHWHLADAELVDEAEVQRLLDDVGAGDRDEPVAGDLASPSRSPPRRCR